MGALMLIMRRLPEGQLVLDSDQYFERSRFSLGPGNSWDRRRPDMDDDYDSDNPAYSDDDFESCSCPDDAWSHYGDTENYSDEEE